MSSFVRLQDGEANEIERLLLDSASEDVPSSGARARTLLALGVSVGATASALSSGAIHAATGAVSGGGSAKAGSVTALMLAKWLGMGAAIGAFTAACIAVATTPGVFERSRSTAVNGAAVAAAVPAVPAGPAGPAGPASLSRSPLHANAPRANTEAPAEAPSTRTDAPSTPNAAIPHPSRTVTAEVSSAGASSKVGTPYAAGSPGSGSNVLAEVASLDRARAALASGDARSALVQLAEHERRFAGGTLEPETVVLRVRAWLQLGQRARALDLVNRFLSAHPESAQAARLRALVGAPPR